MRRSFSRLKSLLEEHSYEISISKSTATALEDISLSEPDLVIIEYTYIGTTDKIMRES